MFMYYKDISVMKEFLKRNLFLFLFFTCTLAQVMVPNELKFPSSCCVGIASQTSLNIFNPSERWQQVSISITSLSIDGEKVIKFVKCRSVVFNKGL